MGSIAYGCERILKRPVNLLEQYDDVLEEALITIAERLDALEAKAWPSADQGQWDH